MENRRSVVGRRDRKRIDIQILRAVAVTIVVVYHLWPTALPGGFIGVDAFFALSGFLITSHLWRDFSSTPTLAALGRFYVRRVRRLFPAAATVLLAVLIATVAWLPTSEWASTGMHAIASVGIVENWWLYRDAGSYFGAIDPSPLQHFWSLSVEEQFYAVWPLAILALLWGARMLSIEQRRHVIAGAIVTASLLSFIASVGLSGTSGAYFHTVGRVWEFGVGAVLGLYAHLWMRPFAARTRTLLAAAGTLGLVVGALFMTSGPDYPGVRALIPVIATALVLIGVPREGLTSVRVLQPMQRIALWVGDASYSIYLWHWPLIILLPLALRVSGQPAWVPMLVLALTLLLSALSMRYIERIGRPAQVAPRRRLHAQNGALMRFSAIAVVIGALATGSVVIADRAEARSVAEARASVVECGADAGADCDPQLGDLDRGLVAGASADIPGPWQHHCIGTDAAPHAVCNYGDPDGDQMILLWGDSHAGSWAGAFDEMGQRTGARVIVAARDACPTTALAPVSTVNRDISVAEQLACQQRNDWVLQNLVPQADEIVFANFSTAYADSDSVYTKGYAELIAQLADMGKRVTMVEDVPLTGDRHGNRVDRARCLALYGEASCRNPVDQALDTHSLRDFLASRVGDRTHFLSISDRFCDATECFAAIGGLPVYHDESHLTESFARSLGVWFASELHRAPLLQSSSGA
ncbi:acyltransferase family protein [Leucobacter musarum]|uniref:acyltransferase family protein n=1 Tax=Leucobacter musarum TaxID=1930747 RepID=UPI0006A78184|nr:acyltransferase family protein [Leucobacter musarum]